MPPGNDIGDSLGCVDGAIGVVLHAGEGGLEFVGFCLDEALEQLDLGCLRVPVIHHFVQQLIDDHEVVADGLLLCFLEVAFEDVHEGVQEAEDHDGVVVLLGDGDQVEIVVLVEVEEVVFLVLDDRPRYGQGYFKVYSSYSRIFLLKMS